MQTIFEREIGVQNLCLERVLCEIASRMQGSEQQVFCNFLDFFLNIIFLVVVQISSYQSFPV